MSASFSSSARMSRTASSEMSEGFELVASRGAARPRRGPTSVANRLPVDQQFLAPVVACRHHVEIVFERLQRASHQRVIVGLVAVTL